MILAAGACTGDAAAGSDFRVRAERIAEDTTARAWRHAVGVDSVRMRGDTTVVWVSPRNWQATDAPQAGVHVTPSEQISTIQWVMGG